MDTQSQKYRAAIQENVDTHTHTQTRQEAVQAGCLGRREAAAMH